MSPLVRPATLADAGAIWHLLGHLVVSHRPQRETFDALLPRIIDDADACLLVADAGKARTLGYVHATLRTSLYANGPVCWISELVVDVDARHRGLGRALMREAETWAARRDAAEVTLATSRADDFYESLGYEAGARYFKRRM